MRFLVWVAGLLLVAVAAGWGGSEWLAQRTTEALSGHGARAESVRPSGFPAHVGLDIAGLSVPAGPVLWQMPELRAQAPLWAPLHWTFAPALPQTVEINGMRFALSAQAARSGVDLAPGLRPPVKAATARLDAPALTYEAAASPSLAARSLSLDLAQAEGPRYRMALRAEALAFPPGLVASLTPKAHLPDAIETVTLQGDLGFDAPLAFGGGVALRSVSIRDSEIIWGGNRLAAAGDVQIGLDGRPEGEITLATRDWQPLLEFALNGKLVDARMEQMLTTFATYMAAQSPDGMLSLPLAFRAGQIWLGPVPLGAAPVLR